ncbi:MAG: leucine-rich repeat protein [Clostridia bacterium]|nr:leucine-rich repeat protein [Clostridia bacterium]
MKRQLISLISLLCMVIAFLPVTGLAQDSPSYPVVGGNIYYTSFYDIPSWADDEYGWEYDDEGGATFTLTPELKILSADSTVTEVTIPAKINNLPVTRIETRFHNCPNLISINFEGSYAYSSMNGMLLSYDKKTLLRCPRGKSGECAVPDDVVTLGASSFLDCTRMTSVFIPKSVKTISASAFKGCEALGDVYFGGNRAQWQSISIAKENECLKNATIHFSEKSYYTVTWDAAGGSVSPASSRVEYKTAVGELPIPERQFYSFDGWYTSASGGTKITKDTVITGNTTFYAHWSVIPMELAYPVTGGNIYLDTATGTITGADASVTAADIPAKIEGISVKAVGENAFTNLKKLKSVTLPNGVESIGNGAFYGCGALTSVKVPSTVTSIGDYAFRMCTALTDITLPDGISKIGARTFYNCKSIKRINIPKKVMLIDDSAFILCSGLTNVYYAGSAAEWNRIDIQSGNDPLINANVRYNTTMPEAQPVAVTITSVTFVNGNVSLEWSAANGIDGYRVYKKTGTGGWKTVCASTAATSFIDTDVTPGTKYTYTVRSYVGSEYSTDYNDTAKSITVPKTAEPTPVTINSIACKNGAVVLAWDAEDGVDGYRLYRKTGSGKWTTLVASTTATAYTDTAVTAGTTYSYTVRSFVGSAYSTGYNDTAKSIKVTGSAVEPSPVAITSIKCVNGAVVLAWQPQSGVDGYRVHKKTGSGKWTTLVASTTAAAYTDTAVTEGTTYTYTVRSFVGSEYSTGYNDTAKSIKVTAASAAEPPAVTISSIQSTGGMVVLSWNAAPGVDGYRVYRKTGSGKWTTVCASTTDTMFIDTNVTAGTTYKYTVRSFIGSTYSSGYNDTAKSIKAK